MKRKKNITKMFLILGILTFCSIPIILNFTTGQKITINQKIDLNNQRIKYSALVKNMTKLEIEEATTIKGDIYTKITNKMTELNLEENLDYEIINLNKIEPGANLTDIIHNNNIIINSIESSKKAIGKFKIDLKVKENIDNRSIDSIIINPKEKDGLGKIRANLINFLIVTRVSSILNTGQENKKDRDYKITNLDLIKEGAKFDDYHEKIKVKGISDNLEGTFPIKFNIE